MKRVLAMLSIVFYGVLYCAVAAFADTVFTYIGDAAYYQDEFGKIGLMDRSGAILCKAQFDYAYPFEGDFAIVETDGLCGVLRQDGKVIVQPKYWIVSIEEEVLFLYPPTEDDDSDTGWGDGPVLVADKNGVLLEDIPWSDADIGEGLLTVERYDGRHVLMDLSGREIFSLEAKHLRSVSEGRIVVRYLDGRYAYLSTDGKRIPDRTFEYCGDYLYGYGDFMDKGFRGIIDIDGNTVFQLRCDSLGYPRAYSDGMFQFKLNGKIGYVDMTGNVAVEPVWDGGSEFYEGTAFAWRGGKYYLLDRTGAVLKVFDWDDLNPSYLDERDHQGFVKVGGKYRMIDQVGNYIGQDAYEDVGEWWCEGWACAIREGESRWSYINERGEVALIGDWKGAIGFEDGYALAQDAGSGLWGIIDHEGRYVVEPSYSQVEEWEGYIGAVDTKGLGWCLSRKGEKLCPTDPDTIIHRWDFA